MSERAYVYIVVDNDGCGNCDFNFPAFRAPAGAEEFVADRTKANDEEYS